MADNKKATGRDRTRVATNQPYELYYFKQKHGLTVEQAKDIIKRAGNNRDKANELAKALQK
ncbi:DUF3606 domain-containing protein [Rhizobium azibense]|uniref:Uncharacterized protein DUF3606 n=1 Tax=Rhizobium azibense TaxID=1136135 RepID=A0A4R3RUC5_9HYPH|nr:DUF3606 domain-containing protein [Rhizobium azibense]TCU38704.1 uncharacterized protein DUF3606 [Rhizobium azibense]